MDEYNQIAPCAGFVIILVALYVVIRLATSMTASDSRTKAQRFSSQSGLKPSASAVDTPVVKTEGGAGPYRVSGVDKESRLDTVWYCEADSEANARVKGELEGIVVTKVERDDIA